MSGLVRALVVAGVILAVDRASKIWVVEHLALGLGEVYPVFPPFLTFRMAWNRGINFGLFDMGDGTGRWVLVGIAVAICALLLVWAARATRAWIPLAIGCVVGGAIGNVWDRIVYGAVADFLNTSCCGIDNPFSFNIADAAIFVGAVVLILMTGNKEE